METIYIILGLIMLVFGILQIILFFKLWKMTNDVHAIKENKPVDKNTPEDTFWELRKYILLNNVEKAEDCVGYFLEQCTERYSCKWNNRM